MKNKQVCFVLQNNKGQSLIEVLTAVSVMGVTLIGATYLLISSIKASHVSYERTVAINLAQGNLDKVRNIRDSIWINPDAYLDNTVPCNQGDYNSLKSNEKLLSSYLFLQCLLKDQIGFNDNDLKKGGVENNKRINFDSSDNVWKLGNGNEVIRTNEIEYTLNLEFEVFGLPPGPLCKFDNASFVKVTSRTTWGENGQNETEEYSIYLTNWNIALPTEINTVGSSCPKKL